MTHQDFDLLLESRIRKTKSVLTLKAGEYATQDRLHNFKRSGQIRNRTPEEALIGMWTKHVTSVFDIVEGIAAGKLASVAMVDEKIGDTINYLILLEALISERRS